MIPSTIIDNMTNYLGRQLEFFFPDNVRIQESELKKAIEVSLKELQTSFSYLDDKYYRGSFDQVFNYLHGDHYSMFLYLVSKNAYRIVGNENFSSKTFLLNKSLHGIDVFYKVTMPEVFFFVHPLGTILGNATYGNFFSVYQGCTVGAKINNYVYPVFGERTVLYSNASVIGDCKCGDNVVFGAGSRVIDTKVDSYKMVLNTYPDNRFIDIDKSQFKNIFVC